MKRHGVLELVAEIKKHPKEYLLTISGITMQEFEKRVVKVFKMLMSLNLGDLDAWSMEIGNKSMQEDKPRLDLIASHITDAFNLKVVVDLLNNKNYFYLWRDPTPVGYLVYEGGDIDKLRAAILELLL